MANIHYDEFIWNIQAIQISIPGNRRNSLRVLTIEKYFNSLKVMKKNLPANKKSFECHGGNWQYGITTSVSTILLNMPGKGAPENLDFSVLKAKALSEIKIIR